MISADVEHRTGEAVTRALMSRGDVWEVAPGVVGRRGPTQRLFETVAERIRESVAQVTANEWDLPAVVSLGTLSRADYFKSFPQWLTLAGHLSDRASVLERLARSHDPETQVAGALAPCGAALPPALCYNTFHSLAGSVLRAPVVMTAQGTCWRHEGDRHAPLARGWAFTMREMVCVGDRSQVQDFLERGRRRAVALAAAMGLRARLAPASDPFFVPTAKGKAVLQRLKELKTELLVPLEPNRSLAIASTNVHEQFFGDAFDIRLADGTAAYSGCVAFGLDRWTLAVLMEHGIDPEAWPSALQGSRNDRNGDDR